MIEKLEVYLKCKWPHICEFFWGGRERFPGLMWAEWTSSPLPKPRAWLLSMGREPVLSELRLTVGGWTTY